MLRRPGALGECRGLAAAAAAGPRDQPREAHFKPRKDASQVSYMQPHPVWTESDLARIEITHKRPELLADRLAYATVKTLRTAFDVVSGYAFRKSSTENQWLTRIIFLETLAGVPGIVAGAIRHLRSLRRMKRDGGWIHSLIEEAENERVHLLTALELKQPGFLIRSSVVLAQGVFVSFYGLAYMLSPRYSHSFVGHLEEEAVRTYTKCLADFDAGLLPVWASTPAPEIAIKYWGLSPDAGVRDVIEAIRADESWHRDSNHHFAELVLDKDAVNPHAPGA